MIAGYRTILLIGVLIVSGFLGIADGQLPETTNNVRFDEISTAQGLSQSSVFCMEQDKKGFIWIGTRDGLNRYDGYDFVSFKNNPQDTNSLSNNEITKIFVNSLGNLWIGTRGGGLNYFNQATYTFTRYSELNYENIVRDVFEDKDGHLWVGTSEGLLMGQVNKKTNRYTFVNRSISGDFFDNGAVVQKVKSSASVISILGLSQGVLFIGTEHGLYLYNNSKNTFTRINLGESDNTIVTSLLADGNGVVWAGTFNGLVKLTTKNAVTNTFELEFYNIRQQGTHRLLRNRIEAIKKDCFGDIWVGTHGGGLVKIGKNGETLTFVNDASDIHSLGDNLVNALLMDNSGVLWIGTESNGCNKLDLYRKKFVHIRNVPNRNNSLCSNSVTAIAGTGKEIVWIGSSIKGLDKLVYNNNGSYKIEHYNDIPVNANQTVSEIISLFQDKSGVLWIGNASNSIVSYKKGEGFRPYPMSGYVFSINQDKQGGLWIGTWGQGLSRIDASGSIIKRFSKELDNPESLSSDKILATFNDNWGNLWVGTKAGGVNIASLSSLYQGINKFQTFKHDETDASSVVHNDIYCITQDHKGNIWLGTGGGLSKVVWGKNESKNHSVTDKTVKFISYLERDGLPNSVIYGILEDDRGNLWLSTNNGLSMFNPETKEFNNYGVNDGLQANEFRSNSFAKDAFGNMFFGGVNGITVFNPNQIKDNPCLSNVVITRLKVFNNVVQPGTIVNGRKILDEDISQTKEIELTYKEKEITFYFSALHYANPQRVHYAYRLLGFNDKWQTAEGNTRSVSYTNLDDGKYVFQVKATNNDGKWNENPLEIKITMLPPFWRKPWFYLVYAGIIVFLLLVFQRYSLIAAKEKNRIAIERFEHKKQLEISQAKMRFFTNVSHEIRTPLTLISDPLKQVLSSGAIDETSRRNLSLISSNVGRLLNLVNQLLQLRNIDMGSIKLNIAEVPFAAFLKEIMGHFEQAASIRNIRFSFINELGETNLYLDKEMISTVFYNLLSNAFKFTPDNGSITVIVYPFVGKMSVFSFFDSSSWFAGKRNLTKWIAIDIDDSGSGIPHKEIKHIFDRFYQVNDPNSMHHAGSGIGLALVKEYLGLHRGLIKVVSKPGKGSIFSVYLRQGNQHFKAGQFTVEGPENISSLPQLQSITVTEVDNTISVSDLDSDEVKDAKPTILIIEDDKELAGYITDNLSKTYDVKLAYDGKSGLKNAISILPDLVISDVMLPEMNGLQVCQKLKTDVETSHIPIILLTARSSDENVMEGYEHGADIYLAKPFNIDILAKQVKSLIESRVKMRKKFSQQLVLMPTDVTLTSTDERFLKKLIEVTDAQLADSEFDVSGLVNAMNMSHTVILRKVKALTDMSLVDFIKNQRLKKAALILQKGKISIAEVGYMVGFSDPKYFSKCFIKEFGKTPTEYCNDFK